MTGNSRFQIKNPRGQIVGAYDASSKAEALNAMARDAGYRDYADFKRRAPASDRPWWLTVRKVQP